MGGLPTSSGNVTITITAPIGYSVAYPMSLTSLQVTDGELTAVSNGLWAVAQNLDNRQITLTMNSGVFIGAGGESTF